MNKKLKYIYIFIISIFIAIYPSKIYAYGISLNKNEMLLGVGYSETLIATISDDLTESNITWKSSNEKVAIVTRGKVTAISYGEATITATISSQKVTCKVVVNDSYKEVKGINLNKSTLNLLIGTSESLTYEITPQDATNKTVSWKSSDNNIVTVVNGKVTAKKTGSATITVTASGYKSTCVVNVVDHISLKGITFNKTKLTIKENESETLKVNYNPCNATNKNISWRSSNKNVVKVDTTGKITGVSAGEATITAISADNGLVATCKVTVEAISKKVTSIKLDKTELTITAGETATLKETISPNYAENKNVVWESTDSSIATVDSGKITAIVPGETEIKVISEDGKKEATCKVIVVPPQLKAIMFKEKEITIYKGDKTKLTPNLEPANSVLENPIWSSSDDNIAKIENGTIDAINIGKTTITVSTGDGSITASIDVTVQEKPKEKLSITIEGYELNFTPDIKVYSLQIGNEKTLTINTNISDDKIVIKGNQNLENGSIITIEVNEEENVTYIINIKKKGNYTIVFIAIISILLLLNLIRIFIKNKKK